MALHSMMQNYSHEDIAAGENNQVGWESNRSLFPIGEVIVLDRSQTEEENIATVINGIALRITHQANR